MDKWYKILKIIVMAIFIVSFCTKIFATFDFTYNNTNYSLPDLPAYNTSNYTNYFIFRNSTTYYLVLVPYNYEVVYNNTSDNTVQTYHSLVVRPKPNESRVVNILAFTCSLNGNSWSTWNITQDNSGCYFTNFNNSNNGTRYVIYSTTDIYNLYSGIFYKSNLSPSILNASSEIEDWSFDYLQYDMGGYEFIDTDEKYYLIISYNGFDYYLQLTDNSDVFIEDNVLYIPQQLINNNVNFITQSDITFDFGYEVGLGGFLSLTSDSYTVSITQEYADDLNNNADRTLQNQINNQLTDLNNQFSIFNTNWQHYQDTAEDTNEKVDQINNTINDSSIDSGASDLPSIDLNDPTQRWY